MKKLYVIDKAVMIPGYGTREPGDYFEMSADEIEKYANHVNLSTTAPKTKSKSKAPAKPPVGEQQSEDDES